MDMREKEISVIYIGAGFLAGLILQLFLGAHQFFDILLGCVVGIVFLLIARLSNEAVGYGDALMIITTGVFLGLVENMLLLLSSIAAAALCSIVLLIFKINKKRDAIPFVPFMLCGYIFLLAAG